MKTPFPQEPELVAVALAHKNPDHTLIADRASPRTPPLKSPAFKYTKMSDPLQAFRLPNTKVSATGRVNRLEMTGEPVIGETEDNGIDIPLSYFDSNSNNEGIDVKRQATELGMNIVLLQHEVDVAGVMFNPANYAFKEQLVGAEQLNDAAYAGNPIKLIRDGMRKPFMKPNVLIFGDEAWAEFSTSPAIVSAVLGNDGQKGIAKPEQVAALFGVQEVLVGEGWFCISKPGQTAEMARVWGPHAAAVYRDRTAGTLGGITFSFTAQYGNRVAGSIEDKSVGLRGGTLVRTGESTKTVVVSPHAGYFWEDLVAVE